MKQNWHWRYYLALVVVIVVTREICYPFTRDLNVTYRFGVHCLAAMLLLLTYMAIDNLISKKISQRRVSKPKDEQKE
jgi:uncharacterized membrane-anchored protein